MLDKPIYFIRYGCMVPRPRFQVNFHVMQSFLCLFQSAFWQTAPQYRTFLHLPHNSKVGFPSPPHLAQQFRGFTLLRGFTALLLPDAGDVCRVGIDTDSSFE